MSPTDALFADMDGKIALRRDPHVLALYGSDVFNTAANPPLAVAIPQDAGELAKLVRAATRHGIALRPRGAGLSYTGGYLPRGESEIVVDCRALDAVVSIDEQNLVAVVEAGCTWKTLREKLEVHGLDTEIAPPVSGGLSTIGGGVSQGLPGPMDGILSISVVLPSGQVLKTGAAAYGPDHIPFHRMTGPDLTGLFVGDCGALGIKTQIALRLREKPARCSHLAFLFEDLSAMAQAAASIGRSGLARRCMGLDPAKARQAKTPTLGDALASGWQILKASGPIQALRVASQALRPLPAGWPLYITIEGDSSAEVAAKSLRVRTLARGARREIDTAIPEALYAQPFSIRGAAGPRGEAWVPVHGVFPPTRVSQVADALEDHLAANEEALGKAGITTGLLVSASGPQVLFEPMFMWEDELSPVVREHIDTARIRGYRDPVPDPDVRELVTRQRREIRDLFYRLGAIFLQKGTFYPDHPVESGVPSLLAAIECALKEVSDSASPIPEEAA